MATGVQLSQMIADLRAEVGHSLQAAQGVNSRDMLAYRLRAAQSDLYEENAWPFLLVWRPLDVKQHVRYYAYADDLPFQQITEAWAMIGNQWQAMGYGIGAPEFNTLNSDKGVEGWPVRKWQHDADRDMREVWPIPTQDGLLRFRGLMPLKPLLNDSDKSTLDGPLVVLTAAAGMLARSKAEDAQLVGNRAAKRLTKLLGRGQKRKPFVVGGSSEANPPPRPYIDFIPMGVDNG